MLSKKMKKSLLTLLLLPAFMFCAGGAKAQNECMGEIRLFTYSFVPMGWLECAGQTLNIAQYSALFSILGTTYGGNGTSTFVLPDLRGKTPIHPGSVEGLTVVLGQYGGTETETMTEDEMPAHTHAATATPACNSGDATSATAGFYSVNPARGNEFNSASNATSGSMSIAVSSNGGVLPRNNMQPYSSFIWCICTSGIYPTRE